MEKKYKLSKQALFSMVISHGLKDLDIRKIMNIFLYANGYRDITKFSDMCTIIYAKHKKEFNMYLKKLSDGRRT